MTRHMKEQVAKLAPAALDVAHPAAFAAVVVVGRDADQSRGGLVVDLPELGQLMRSHRRPLDPG